MPPAQSPFYQDSNCMLPSLKAEVAATPLITQKNAAFLSLSAEQAMACIAPSTRLRCCKEEKVSNTKQARN